MQLECSRIRTLRKDADAYFFEQSSDERKYLLKLIRKTCNASKVALGTQLWDTVDIDTKKSVEDTIIQKLLELKVIAAETVTMERKMKRKHLVS